MTMDIKFCRCVYNNVVLRVLLCPVKQCYFLSQQSYQEVLFLYRIRSEIKMAANLTRTLLKR